LKRDDGPLHLDRLDPAQGSELLRAVEAAKRQLPSAHDLAALAASLSVQGLPLPSQAAPPGAPGASPRLRIRWLTIGAGVVGAIVLSVQLARPPVIGSKTPAPSTPTAPTDQAPSRIAAPAPFAPGSPVARPSSSAFEATPAAPTLPVDELRADPSHAPLPASGAIPETTARSGPTPVPPAPEPAPVPATRSAVVARGSRSPRTAAEGASLEAGSKVRPSELELLRDARLALRSSPALALGLTEQHSALYPRGTMAQERELIAISALVQLGRHAAVLSRAQRFEHDFPSSPYRKQIAQMAE
jgi:hypothetical protein